MALALSYSNVFMLDWLAEGNQRSRVKCSRPPACGSVLLTKSCTIQVSGRQHCIGQVHLWARSLGCNAEALTEQKCHAALELMRGQCALSSPQLLSEYSDTSLILHVSFHLWLQPLLSLAFTGSTNSNSCQSLVQFRAHCC